MINLYFGTQEIAIGKEKASVFGSLNCLFDQFAFSPTLNSNGSLNETENRFFFIVRH